MAAPKVKINKKEYKLKFGYGVIRRVAHAQKISGYNAFGDYVQGLKFGETDDVTFEQFNFLGILIHSAIANEIGDDPEFSEDDVVDAITADPSSLEAIMTAFVESMPSSEDVKKGNLEAPKKSRGKKK